MIYKVIAIIGPSAAGKDSILDGVASRTLETVHKIIRTTTRPKRDNESLDAYHFISDADWSKKGWLISNEFRGWHYGISMDDLSQDKVNIGIFTLSELKTMRDLPQVFILKVIYISVDGKIRLLRALEREDKPDTHEICRRFLADEEDFQEIGKFYDYIYKNEDVLDLDRIEGDIIKIAQDMMQINQNP